MLARDEIEEEDSEFVDMLCRQRGYKKAMKILIGTKQLKQPPKCLNYGCF
jgi:hypothetical protein